MTITLTTDQAEKVGELANTCVEMKLRPLDAAYIEVVCLDGYGKQIGEPQSVPPLKFGKPS